jgi:hypothetical protein
MTLRWPAATLGMYTRVGVGFQILMRNPNMIVV